MELVVEMYLTLDVLRLTRYFSEVLLIQLQFPPEFDTGDAHKVKMRLPNHVYNKLKVHSMKENKRANKIHEKKEHSTAVRVAIWYTWWTISQLSQFCKLRLKIQGRISFLFKSINLTIGVLDFILPILSLAYNTPDAYLWHTLWFFWTRSQRTMAHVHSLRFATIAFKYTSPYTPQSRSVRFTQIVQRSPGALLCAPSYSQMW